MFAFIRPVDENDAPDVRFETWGCDMPQSPSVGETVVAPDPDNEDVIHLFEVTSVNWLFDRGSFSNVLLKVYHLETISRSDL